MSQRALRLPIRTLSRPTASGAQWTCRRCLATQADASPSLTRHDDRLALSPRSEQTLAKPLPHQIPAQYLQHTKAELPPSELEQRQKTTRHKQIVGVVVSSGKMHKTVTVRVPKKQWNTRVKKHYITYDKHLVHDPNSSINEGDVIRLHRLRVSTAVHHVVADIVSPFGTPIADRPPIPSPDERLALYKEKRFAKLHRRELRQKAADGDADAIDELISMGLDPGVGVEEGAGRTDNLQKGIGQKRTPSAGAILGEKGQKLPQGVLPGGKREVGKINERAQENKGKKFKFDKQAEKNILEAKEEQS